jgi:hypothetical protein
LGLDESLGRIGLSSQSFTTGKNVIAVIKIGDLENRQIAGTDSIFDPMKTINRMALGTISSLLLSAGLARVAQKLDPVSNSLSKQNFGFSSNDSPANSCVVPCLYQTE